MNECWDRIEDTVHAVKAALLEGVVIGGGCALLYSSRKALSHLKLSNED